MMVMMNENKKVWHELKQKGHLYKPPTHDEMMSLMEADTLFNSNLFRLQLNELLSEVKVNQTKTSAIEGALHKLHELLNSLGSQKVKQTIDDIHLYNSAKSYNMQFEKPSSVDVIGSFLLNTVTKPITNVDVAVTLPKALFEQADFEDIRRYLDKRAIYLRVLGSELATHSNLFSVSLSTFRGDVRKPILVVHPQKDKEQNLTTKFVIRILPCIPQDVVKRSLLSPKKCNFKLDNPEELPTPHYNNMVLEDMFMITHLKYLHTILAECPTLLDAIPLFKVWLRQRQMYNKADQLNGFLVSMLMGYLYSIKRITKHMTSYQIVRLTLHFIATYNIDEGIFMERDDKGEISSQWKANVLSSYEVAFIDPSGILNLASRISKHSWEAIKEEALLSLQLLDDASLLSFEALFMTPVEFHAKFDNFVRVHNIPDKPAKQILGDVDWKTYFREKVRTLIAKGLGDRAFQIFMEGEEDKEWNFGDKSSIASNPKEIILLGLKLNAPRARSVLIPGPSAEDKAASDEFIQFWGDKAELRRFKDGRIIYAVVWDNLGGKNITHAIVCYVLQRHLNVPLKHVDFIGEQLDSFIAPPAAVSYQDATAKLLEAFNELQRSIVLLGDELPLAIVNLLPIDQAFRYTSVVAPLAAQQQITLGGERKFVDSYTAIIQLVASNRWPDDTEAIDRVKTSYYIQLANKIEEKLRIRCSPAEDHLAVTYRGYVFKLVAHVERQVHLLSLQGSLQHTISDINQDATKERSRLMKIEYEEKPVHTSLIRALYLQNPAFGPTTRLALRWLCAHKFSSHIPTEAVEWLVAYVFTSPRPYSAPAGHFTGFLRFLHLMATFNFEKDPIVVDLHKDFTTEDYNTIQDKFNATRKGKDCPLFIVTPRNKDSLLWTRLKPSRMILKRIAAYARQSELILKNQFKLTQAEPTNTTWQSIFVSPMQDYDVIISLNPECIAHYEYNVQFPIQSKEPAIPKGKHSKKAAKVNILIDVNPVESYVRELEVRFSDKALFFYDKMGGDNIALVWKPSAFVPKPFKWPDTVDCMPMDQQGKMFLVPNVPDMIVEMKKMGEGLVTRIETIKSPQIQQ